MCGCRNLGEELRRLGEGAVMLRAKGEPGAGDVVEAVRHMRRVQGKIRTLSAIRDDELMAAARDMQAPYELVVQVTLEGKFPVVNFAAGGIATPADAALMMQLGADGIFVGSGIFESDDPPGRARAIVEATANYDNPSILLKVSCGLGEPMKGCAAGLLKEDEKLQVRGW